MIKRLKNNQIDKILWDQVITGSDDPFVYLLSWYLDIVTPGWECLVNENYRMVMPLPVKYKFGIPYLVQPPFCQKTGVFGIGVKNEHARKFFRRIFWTFPYYNLQLPGFTGLEKRKYLNGRINYTLDLSASYETLVKDYKENTQRNIEKSKKHNCNIKDCGITEFLEFSNSHLEGLNSYNFQIFSRLITETSERKMARIEKAVDANGEILSVACFLVWNMRVFYLAGASSPKGKQVSSMFLVFDKLIHDFASTGCLIDFEGSMIPGVARFFSGFGAKSFYYYHLKKYLFFYR